MQSMGLKTPYPRCLPSWWPVSVSLVVNLGEEEQESFGRGGRCAHRPDRLLVNHRATPAARVTGEELSTGQPPAVAAETTAKTPNLHRSLTQEQRVKAVQAFRDGSVDFLLATDLASRGLDIKNVDVVMNFELPQSYDIYQHRIGRTARAGRSGRSITLATEAERKILKTAVVSRVLDNDKVDTLHTKLETLESEVDEVLEEEKNERHIQTLEMQVRRSENLMKHEDEIRARPKRTWFESQREKAEAKKVSKAELNGLELPEKRAPMSRKQRKREELKEERGYKKTKADRVVKAQRGGVKAQAKKDAKKIVRKMEAKDGMKKGRSAPKKGGFKGKPKGRK
ncbi:Similar to ATP-dependent RNA helicase drs1; acc. no. A7F4L5 [Pyronema omphalodes CBS 100304]|uniref:RNA helicase n=1 Tax=Pyronema omphalodes (strain CBS 100304) TaxID=1076935 RepID=U4L7J8_PYROM|nr:Similar to ATP-dependent RNA helicase drs1; acc. no. A7F4L5 [Pyronema omphalodes CBS 100304]